MKNKTLIIGVFIFFLLVFGFSFVSAQNQVRQRVHVESQGDTNQIQTQTQQRLQDGALISTSTQAQNQNGLNNAQQRRSMVANAVQEMLQLAERNQGIGQQIKLIAQNQNQNQEKLELGLERVQNRNKFVRFFFGLNYKEINNVNKILQQNKEKLHELNQINNELINQEDLNKLQEQIQNLEQTNLQVENSLKNVEGGFSLFGWFSKLFIK
ncbi:MAG: hypothetical protein PHH83_00815 [Patescibacteria group bacterium]|nr:hypothetical protein [Patescibacteria group bacterium]